MRGKNFQYMHSIVAKHLSWFNKSFKFTSPFSLEKLKNYEFFVSVVDEFMGYFGLQKVSYRELDKYLWGLAKIGV